MFVLNDVGHSRTIIGLEQSQSDSTKMFLLLLDPLKEKNDILKIKTSSCGNAVHRYMRKSIRQETHHQYELVFVNGLLSDSKEREVGYYSNTCTCVLIFCLDCLVYKVIAIRKCKYELYTQGYYQLQFQP